MRLEEPAVTADGASGNGGGGPWHVRYLLQSVHDPSLLLSADDVWHDRARRALRQEGFDAKQHLLGALGQAARIEPRIEESLRHHAPAGYATDATKIERALGWRPQETFESGLRKTVQWYLENTAWWQHTLTGEYRLARIGQPISRPQVRRA